jgi:hypothetical protein
MADEGRPKAASAAIFSAWFAGGSFFLLLIGWAQWREDFMVDLRQSFASWIAPAPVGTEAGANDSGDTAAGLMATERANSASALYALVELHCGKRQSEGRFIVTAENGGQANLCGYLINSEDRRDLGSAGRGTDLGTTGKGTDLGTGGGTTGGSTAGGTTGGIGAGNRTTGGVGAGNPGTTGGLGAGNPGTDTGSANAGYETGSANRKKVDR